MTQKIIDTDDLDTSSSAETILPARGRVKREKIDSDLVQEVEVVSAHNLTDKAAKLAFLEEPVDVMVHESADPNASMIVETWCNGIPQRFIRGQVQTVKRKYVSILANAKETAISTREARDYDGNMTTAINKHTALKYPFSVVRDENPRGAAWLKQALAG